MHNLSWASWISHMRFNNIWILIGHSIMLYIGTCIYQHCKSLPKSCKLRLQVLGSKIPNISFSHHLSLWYLQLDYSETCVERPLPWEITCLEGPLLWGRKSHISMQMNLSPKTICLENPQFYGQWWQSFKTGSTVLPLCQGPDLGMDFLVQQTDALRQCGQLLCDCHSLDCSGCQRLGIKIFLEKLLESFCKERNGNLCIMCIDTCKVWEKWFVVLRHLIWKKGTCYDAELSWLYASVLSKNLQQVIHLIMLIVGVCNDVHGSTKIFHLNFYLFLFIHVIWRVETCRFMFQVWKCIVWMYWYILYVIK